MSTHTEPTKTTSKESVIWTDITEWEKWFLLQHDHSTCPDCQGTLTQAGDGTDIISFKCQQCPARFILFSGKYQRTPLVPEKSSSKDETKDVTVSVPATDWERWYILKNNYQCPDCEKGILQMWPSPECYECSWCHVRFTMDSERKEINRIPNK